MQKMAALKVLALQLPAVKIFYDFFNTKTPLILKKSFFNNIFTALYLDFALYTTFNLCFSCLFVRKILCYETYFISILWKI